MKRKFRESELPPLIQACIDNDIAKVEKLVSRGDVNMIECRDQRGRTPLHLAAYRGNVDMISLLVQYGGDVWTKDDIGNTLMHLCNHVEVIRFLAKQGLSPFERNINGDTPLMLGMRFCARKEVLDLLKQLEQEEVQDEPPVSCPLFNTRRPYNSIQDNNSTSWKDELFRDFGIYQILLMLFLIAALSLYITYCIVGEMPFNSPLLNDIAGHEEHK